MAHSYATQAGELVARSGATGHITWQGKPNGYPVAQILPVPSSDDCIVLLDYEAHAPWGDFENLLRCRPDGSVVWTAKLPTTGNNAYVNVRWQEEGKTLWAADWSGRTATVDVNTGAIRSHLFTK